MEEKPKKKLKKLLDRLQVESWQLELLVSGFAIFLAANAIHPVSKYATKLMAISEGLNFSFDFIPIIAIILLGAVYFIFINLILHIIFRGMWISAIGLRSISGDVDFEILNFAKPFDRFMRKKIKSFDFFIQRLEDISSVIFAFTFLIIFMMISVGLFVFFLLFVGYIISLLDDFSNSKAFAIVGVILVFIFFFGALLYFIDFITLGFFKRKRWIAIWYYPIYRFFSIITFSWLYRPLYYNLIDNKFGRRVGAFLVPYFILIVLFSTTDASVNLYIPKDKEGLLISNRYFDDSREEDQRIRSISIPSKYVKNGYLELFLRYNARNDDRIIKEICPDIVPDETPGIGTDIVISGGDEKYHSPADSILGCISQLYAISLNDSLFQNLDYYFYTHPTYEEEGIKTIIDISSFARGKHVLDIKRMEYNFSKDTTTSMPYVSTPIWLE